MSKEHEQKQRKMSVLILTIVLALFMYIGAIFYIQKDEYIFGWLSSFAQALLVFAFFKFDCIKEKLRNGKLTHRSFAILSIIGAVLVAFGITFELVWLSQIGSAIVLLGLNALVSYLDYEFSKSDNQGEGEEHKSE